MVSIQCRWIIIGARTVRIASRDFIVPKSAHYIGHCRSQSQWQYVSFPYREQAHASQALTSLVGLLLALSVAILMFWTAIRVPTGVEQSEAKKKSHRRQDIRCEAWSHLIFVRIVPSSYWGSLAHLFPPKSPSMEEYKSHHGGILSLLLSPPPLRSI